MVVEVNVFAIFMTLLVMAVLFGAAYFFTRWLLKRPERLTQFFQISIGWLAAIWGLRLLVDMIAGCK